ncbi:gephyrin-like molybdotransferase Glp [Sphingobium aromaticiconvertens]|uniref:molybdopterin molybdotransferase MoeA n=1 Tax=Sphingobium aromaticiconvertens TaxID=365341 RepID=UPI00301757C3
MSLLPVAEAQARLLALGRRLPSHSVAAAQGVGRWLTDDIIALRSQPWADLSAMDGYAIRAAEWPGPWRLSGESAAGQAIPTPLAPGETCRIFTGAPVPPGADAILIQENAERIGDQISGLPNAPASGQHVRPAGSDFRESTVLLRAGTCLNPAHIGLAVLGGHGLLPVARKVRVALLSTGNELVAAGQPIAPGQLPSSNAVMLPAMLAGLPCEVIDLGIVPDDLAAMMAAFDRVREADIIVSTGGASVGDHDLVRPAFAAVGGTLDFWKIAMRPGKPLIAGTLDSAVFLGLPGNPVSAFVTAFLFLLPLVRHMSGAPQPLPRQIEAIIDAPLAPTAERDEYLRAFHRGDRIVALTAQDSAATASLADADCLILRPAKSPAAKAGDAVITLPLT